MTFVQDSPIWRWFITDLKSSRVLTSLTTIATEVSLSRLLAASWPAALTVPSGDPRVRTIYQQFDDPTWDEPFVAEGIRALLGFRDTGTDPIWACEYAGMILNVNDATQDGVAYTTLNAWDVRKYLELLPLVDTDGTLPSANGITYSGIKANVIARAAVENWIANNPGCLLSILLDTTSGLDEDCAELTITFDRGSSIADVWSALEQTGAIDIVLLPVYDPLVRPGVLNVVNFEVEHGSERYAAIFSWDRSPRSLPDVSRFEDGLKRANDVRGFTDAVEPVTPVTDPDSISKFGEYVLQKTWVGQPAADAITSFATEELLFRKDRQTTVGGSPAVARAAQPIQEYDIGDRVPFYASEGLRKPLAGLVRVYGVPFQIGDDAHETVTELQVSADAIG